MARVINKLTALEVTRLKEPGMFADGAGLYIQVTGDGKTRVAKSWIYRFTLRGRTREMGLGSLTVLGLAEARGKAAEFRRLVHDGVDPIDAKAETRTKAALDAAKSLTFTQCAKRFIESHRVSWTNPKHAAQWTASLKTYAEPVIGALPIQTIETAHLMKILEPIWSAKPETAKRVRGRIEAVLDWASALEYRVGNNPARLKGHLDKLLPARSRLRPVKHHAALPYDQLPAFMASLRAQEGISPRALEFLILTAARTGEVIGARPSEIRDRVWTVPKERMKNGKEHRVPLCSGAIAVVEKIREQNHGDFLFPGGKRDKPLSNMAMLAVLKRMGLTDLTAHGFRSTFDDWATECTNAPREVIEMALAHTIEDKVDAAYRRGDLFVKRRWLMEEWAQFCAGGETIEDRQVVPLLQRR
jgi:integrase